jgi:carotenoid cleavage dioxygenase-like enzyme
VVKPDYVRIRIPASGRASFERLGGQRFDFPAVHPRAMGRAHRWCWGADPWSGAGRSALYKLDALSGETRSATVEGWMVGEPLFVAHPGAAAEDAGVLLAVGSRIEGDAAALFVLDAATLDVLARAEVEVSLPLGFHGSFVAD